MKIRELQVKGQSRYYKKQLLLFVVNFVFSDLLSLQLRFGFVKATWLSLGKDCGHGEEKYYNLFKTLKMHKQPK